MTRSVCSDPNASLVWIPLEQTTVNSKQLLAFAVRASDKRISCEEEFSDSEDEGEGGRRNRESFKHRKRLKVTENGAGADKKPGAPGGAAAAANNADAEEKGECHVAQSCLFSDVITYGCLKQNVKDLKRNFWSHLDARKTQHL